MKTESYKKHYLSKSSSSQRVIMNTKAIHHSQVIHCDNKTIHQSNSPPKFILIEQLLTLSYF